MKSLCGISTRPRGGHRPSSIGKFLQHSPSAVHRLQPQAFGVVWLEGRDLGFRVELGRRQADRLDRTTPVTHSEEIFRGQAFGTGPLAPLFFDVAGGIDQDSIEIEENRFTFEVFHD